MSDWDWFYLSGALVALSALTAVSSLGLWVWWKKKRVAIWLVTAAFVLEVPALWIMQMLRDRL